MCLALLLARRLNQRFLIRKAIASRRAAACQGVSSVGANLPDAKWNARRVEWQVGRCDPDCAIIGLHYLEEITVELTAVLTPAEEGGYIALNPETGTTTQGETVEEAVANLTEATTLYLSELPMLATGHPIITVFSLPTHA